MSYCNNPPYYLSAYALAKKRGFKGTEEEWLQSFTAYELAKKHGFEGTEEEWLLSLRPKVGVGEVTTLDCGEEAQVSISGPADAPVLNFGLPRGEDGSYSWKNTPFRQIKGRKDRVQTVHTIYGATEELDGCSAVMQCPRYLGWRIEGEGRLWLYIGDVVDGAFVWDDGFIFDDGGTATMNEFGQKCNRFIETDGTKFFWYKTEGNVELVGVDAFPGGMEAPAVIPQSVNDDGVFEINPDFYSIVLPAGSEFAILMRNIDSENKMNVSWDAEGQNVVVKGASFGSIPETAGAALVRIRTTTRLENIKIYCSKPVQGRTAKEAIREVARKILTFQWVSQKSILWNDGNGNGTWFYQRSRFTGVPYSSRWFNAHYLGYEITPTTLANALNDPYSIAYDGGRTSGGAWIVTSKSEIGSRGGTGYGLVCSVLQCLLNGNPYPQSNRGFTFDKGFQVTPAVGMIPGSTLLNKSLSHCVLLDEIYDKGYSLVEAEDPCVCRTVHTNDMESPNYLEKKTDIATLDDYAYTVANIDVSGYQANFLDFDNIEIPGGDVRPWRGHKAVYGPYDKGDDGSGIMVTIHGTDTVRLFVPGSDIPNTYTLGAFNPQGVPKYFDISHIVTVDGTYTVDSGPGTVQEQFRFFNSDPVSLHFTEDGTAVFSESRADYAYVKVTGYGSGYAPVDSTEEEDSGTMVIAAGRRYPDLAKDIRRITSMRAVMMRDPTEGDCWGRFACESGTVTSDYRENSGGNVGCLLTVETITVGEGGSTNVAVTGIILDYSNISLTVDETMMLAASISPSNATNKHILWKSSNTNIATVINGYVTAVGEGNAVITAYSAENNAITATCSVAVAAGESGGETDGKIYFSTLSVVTEGMLAKPGTNGITEYNIGINKSPGYYQLPYSEGMFIGTYYNGSFAGGYPPIIVVDNGTVTTVKTEAMAISGSFTFYTATLTGFTDSAIVYVNTAPGGAEYKYYIPGGAE